MTLPSTDRRPWTAADWRWTAALAAAAVAVYARTATFGYIYFDDQTYVANNAYVRHGLSWAGVRWACTATVVDNWHPLTLLLELAVSTLFGHAAGTFHMTNAVLFGVDVGLVFAFLRTATGRAGPAAAAAVLWGSHPLRVESVAWVAELKDVLSGAMVLGCLTAYAAYARRRTPGRYAVVAGLLALALLSKPIAVTVPFVLLLCDYWPLGAGSPPLAPGSAGVTTDIDVHPTAASSHATADVEPRQSRELLDGGSTFTSHRVRRTAGPAAWWLRRVAEKVPLIALSAVIATITVRSQATPGVLIHIPWSVRLSNAAVSIAAYLRQTVWPVGLAVFYPHPWVLRRSIPAATVVGSVGLIAILTIATVVAGRRKRYLPVGWLWFLGMLTPVLGLLQAGDQARADRFTFLPGIGLTIAVVFLAADLLAGHRPAAVAATAVVAAALLACTVRLTATWASVDTIWARADAVVPDNYMARSFLAQIALRDDDPPRAERLAREAVAMAPRSVSDGHLVLARALDAEHRPAEAAVEFAAAERIAPTDPLLRLLAGQFDQRQHDPAAAVRELDRAVRLDPGSATARRSLAVALTDVGRYAEAADQFRRVLAAAPDDAAARAGLADAERSSLAAATRPTTTPHAPAASQP